MIPRDTETTVVWADGEVLRTDRWGRTRSLPRTIPVRAGDVLLESPLGSQLLACGNRVVVENPTTLRVAPVLRHELEEPVEL